MIGNGEEPPKPATAKRGGTIVAINADQSVSVVNQIQKKGGTMWNQAQMDEINKTLPQDTQIGKVVQTAREIKERAEKEQH